MHLNSGLLLRHPSESAYSAMRRFAFANKTFNYPLMVKEAGQRLGDLHALRRATSNPSLINLANHIESNHCKQYGIPLPAYSLNNTNPYAAEFALGLRISRNCPTCAAAFFHSPLFELPWLSECPIHRCPLTAACPGCGNDWPIAAEIWARPCTVCGLRSTRGNLIDIVIDRASWDFSALNHLQCLIDFRHSWTNIRIWGGEDSLRQQSGNYAHYSLGVRSYAYPSIASHVNLAFNELCTTHRIPIEPCLEFSFACDPSAPNQFVQQDMAEYSSTWISEVRRKMRTKVLARIRRYAGPSHQPQLTHDWSMKVHVVGCAFCDAYNYWDQLIEKAPPVQSSMEQNFLRFNGEFGAPPSPHPLPVMTIGSNSAEWDNGSGVTSSSMYSETHFQLPLAAQQLLYKLDLWTTFKAVFRYFEHRLQSRPSAETFDDFLNQDIHTPNFDESISRAMAFDNSKNDVVTIYFPKSLMRLAINTTLTSHWVDTCTKTRGLPLGKRRRKAKALS